MSAEEPEDPSGLPEGEDDEITPLGVPAEDGDGDDDDQPGFPEEGEGDTAG